MDVRVGVIVFLVMGAAVVGGPTVTADAAQSDPLVSQPEDIDTDEVRMNIAVESDGSAEWTIELWVHLDDAETVDAFESLEDDIDEDPAAHTQEFADRIEATVDGASATTEREMSANDFHIETDRQSFAREYGVISYSFQWTGFAAVEAERLHVGDAIDGINIDDGTRLLIEWPEEHELESISPDPDDQRHQAALWHGSETDFISGEPSLVVSPAEDGLNTIVAAISVGAVGVVVIGIGWWYRTRRGESEQAVVDSPPASSADETSDHSGPSSEPSTLQPELMSNEEQLLHLLEENGGRMKQQAVVETLEWTDAKTSKVVSGLREEGNLESFRLGRENVLSFPDEGEEVSTDHST
ncbi:helix-turn-helix transcriptional regulator [Halostagnicola bangensis]